MAEPIDRVIQCLKRSPLLFGVTEEVLRVLDPPPELISLRAGETLMRQDDDNTDCFILVSGRLRVFKEEDGRLIPIGNVLPGEAVGEMALLTNEPRSATVIARFDSELVRFPQSTFMVLAATQPLTMLAMARAIINRGASGSTGARRFEHPAIAVITLTAEIGASALAQALAQELQRYGSSVCVDADFTGLLDELEERFDFVVYAAGPHENTWSTTCLLRADLVLFVASAATPAESGEIERGVLARMDRKILGNIDLVMVHPGAWRRQCGAAGWLERLVPREHHHIRSGNATDLARLARIVAGRAINLVLSGGGARGFAQIGALRALMEFGVPIDRIGGASMGAGIGGLLACGDAFDDRVRQLRELFLQRRPARDMTLPLLSLLTGKKMTRIGFDLFGSSRIEDLPTRYFCVSSDLGRAELVEHHDGLLWIALRATAAMPVVAPPLLKNGRVFVDGGVLNNLPIDVMKKTFSGAVIAIDVSKPEPLIVDRRWDLTSPSGFEILLRKLNPFGPEVRLPGILEMLRRTATLASEVQAREARPQADLLITPPVETFGVTDFDAFDQIVEIGYRHTFGVLEKNRELRELRFR